MEKGGQSSGRTKIANCRIGSHQDFPSNPQIHTNLHIKTSNTSSHWNQTVLFVLFLDFFVFVCLLCELRPSIPSVVKVGNFQFSITLSFLVQFDFCTPFLEMPDAFNNDKWLKKAWEDGNYAIQFGPKT